MQAQLSRLTETEYGYKITSADHEHIYAINYNSIDYTVTRYWIENPCGHVVGFAYDLPSAAAMARKDYITLQ